MAESETDAYVVPVESVPLLLSRKGLPDTWLPVIAYGKPASLAKAFLAGCQDYLKEPFNLIELEFRLNKIFTTEDNSYPLYGRKLALQATECSTETDHVQLSLQEGVLLRLLLKQRGRIVPRDVLFYALWGKPPRRHSRVVDVHISSLRRKLSRLFPEMKNERFIYSAKGKGYILL